VLSIFLVNLSVIGIVVALHYEFLRQISRILPKLKIRHRLRIVLGVFAALTAHAIEVWIFALSFFLMHHAENWGQLQGNLEGTFFDYVYFSFTTYTTLGTGDIQPIGDLRYLTGLESLTGLVLITWTASFLYLEMMRYWDEN
jgi:Ion channel